MKKVDFFTEIFPGELKEISKRRKTCKLDTSGLDAEPGSEGDLKAPSGKLGLIGLALSGGGIRSATFSLGVIQELIKKEKFRLFDYLSTVSGGGYIGSCVSSLLKKGSSDSRYENTYGTDDTNAVKHLRNSSNYLAPPGLLNKLRLPLVILRGILLNLFLTQSGQKALPSVLFRRNGECYK